MDGQLVWKSDIPAEPYGHLEATYSDSTSYLCTAHAPHVFLIWRFHDPTQSKEPPPILNVPPPVLASIQPHVRSFDPDQRGYHPYTVLIGSSAFRASKLRYPYLIASTRNHGSLCKFNFTERDTVRGTISLRSAIIGPSGGVEQCWPPETPPGYRYLQPLIPHPLYRENGRRLRPWTAVHHDSKSQFIVGASMMDLVSTSDGERDCAILTITYRYKSAIFHQSVLPQYDREDIEQRTMNLRIVSQE